MRALRPVLSEKDISQFSYPRSAYSDLVSILKLPPRGYDFGTITSLPQARVSHVAQHLNGLDPDQALKSILMLRDSADGVSLRRAWTDRIWEHSRSVAVGGGFTQIANNNTVYGDLILQQRTFATAKD
jgi:hypothetical protein